MLKKLFGMIKQVLEGIKGFFREDPIFALLTLVATPLVIASVGTSLEPMVLLAIVIVVAPSIVRIALSYAQFPNC